MSQPSPVKPAQVAATVPSSTSSVCGNLISALLKFPLLISQFLNWFLDSSGNFTNAAIQQVVQPGDLIFSASSAGNTALRLLCDGSAVPRALYPDLFLAIGTTYGAGDGSTTFNLPDYKAKFPVGVGVGVGTSAGLAYTIGQSGGEAAHVLTTNEMPPHQHSTLGIYRQTANNNFATGGPLFGDKSNGAGGPQITDNIVGNAGGDPSNVDLGTGFPKAAVAHNNIPPFTACFIFIKT